MDKNVILDLDEIIFVLLGSTFGLFLRLLVKYKYKKKIGFLLDYSSLVNILASFFLGILVQLNPINQNLLLFFYIGFLGCFSTFSSFIYQLFNLIQNRKYLLLLFYYIKTLTLACLFFYIGNIIILLFKM